MEPSNTFDAATGAPLAASAGDRCGSCGERLASDQRYCVNCGDRRGRARFSLTAIAAPQPETAAPVPPPTRRPAAPSGATVITGIATLLLAMGVGVLIGRSSNDSSRNASAPAVQVVTAPGSGPAVAAAATGKTSPAKAKAATKAVKHAKIDKKTAAKAQAAASKVIGGKNLPPPTVKVGAHGQGPGFKGGKFTGDFFGR